MAADPVTTNTVQLIHTERSTMKLLHNEFGCIWLYLAKHMHLPWTLAKIHIVLMEKITSTLQSDLLFRLDS